MNNFIYSNAEFILGCWITEGEMEELSKKYGKKFKGYDTEEDQKKAFCQMVCNGNPNIKPYFSCRKIGKGKEAWFYPLLHEGEANRNRYKKHVDNGYFILAKQQFSLMTALAGLPFYQSFNELKKEFYHHFYTFFPFEERIGEMMIKDYVPWEEQEYNHVNMTGLMLNKEEWVYFKNSIYSSYPALKSQIDLNMASFDGLNFYIPEPEGKTISFLGQIQHVEELDFYPAFYNNNLNAGRINTNFSSPYGQDFQFILSDKQLSVIDFLADNHSFYSSFDDLKKEFLDKLGKHLPENFPFEYRIGELSNLLAVTF